MYKIYISSFNGLSYTGLWYNTEKEAKARCHKDTPCVAIPVKDLIPYFNTQVSGASRVLKKWEEDKNK